MQPAAYPAGTVEQMRAGLFLDGWRTSESLPADWMMKRSGGHTEYLTRNLVLLAKMSAVVRHLREHGYTEQEVDRYRNILLSALSFTAALTGSRKGTGCSGRQTRTCPAAGDTADTSRQDSSTAQSRQQ